jgi:uncharacterized protein (TIGR03437 family)
MKFQALLLSLTLVLPIVATAQTGSCGFSGFSLTGFTNSSNEPTTAFVDPAGGSGTLTLTFTAASGCNWEVSSPQPWVTFGGASSGANSGTSVSIPVTVAPNTPGSSVQYENLSVKVNGSVVASPVVWEDSTSCQVSVLPDSVTLPASGGSGSFNLSLGIYGCWLTYETPPSWFSIGTQVNNQASQTIPYTVAANTGGARTGAITFNLLSTTATFTVNQAAPGTQVPQTITFGALSNVALGAAPFAISATASSGLAVSFASTTPSVCTVAGNTVTVVSFGTCTIAASQGGNADYLAAQGISQSFTVGGQLSVSGGPLTNGNVAVLYSTSVTATGGKPPYTWTLVGGSLPDGGTTVSSSGAILGTPKTPGTYIFTAQATDAAGASALGTFSIKIIPAPLVLTSVSPFPLGNANSPYPPQILSASGGVQPYTFSISNGSLPAGLSAPSSSSPQIGGTPTATGTFDFTVTVTDGAGTTVSASTSITVNARSVNLILSAGNIPFSLTAGSSGVPAPSSVTVQSTDVTQVLNYSVAVTPAAAWLDVTTGSGTTPGSIGIALDPSAVSLSAAALPYQATIDVTCVAPSPCAGIKQTIVVSLTVTALAPQITLTSSLVSFAALAASPGSQSQPLGIQNTGGGTLNIISVTAADSWLKVTGVPSSLAAGPPTAMTVTANTTGLAANFYQSSITAVSSTGTIVVPVTLNVAQSVTMTLNPSGATIQTVAGNPPGSLTGSFNVNVTGGGSINWSAQVLPGAAWLSVSTPSGTATATTAGTVNFAIDPTAAAGLSAQVYAGSIQITSSDAVDSPLVFQLFLSVSPAGTPASPQPGAGGIVYSYNPGGKTPASVRAEGTSAALVSSQTIPIYASSKTPVGYQASPSTANGGAWLSVSPSTGFASASAPGQSVISANPAGLAPGVYRGGVTYAFSSNAVSTVNITLLVGTQGLSPFVTASASAVRVPDAAAACAPTKLVASQTGLVSNFAQPAGWPTLLAVAVNDNCFNTVTDAQVTLSFSNGDPAQLMAFNSATQTYVYTWTPGSVASQVTVTGLATVQGLAADTVRITGEVRPNNPPTLNANTPTHVWNPVIGGSLAPGSIISIYGANLAAEPTDSTAPLGTKLDNTSVVIGGTYVPLYYVSPGQINAQVPFELMPGNQYQVIVVANGIPTATPAMIQVTPAVPGIAAFTTSYAGLFSQGEIIAQHAADYSLVTEASPAVPGESVIFYLAGLGATDNPVGTGQTASANPLSHALAPLTLTLNGNVLPTEFAGLTPTAVGLYQVDFLVPMGTPDGDLKLVVSQAGLVSDSTLLPVHQ